MKRRIHELRSQYWCVGCIDLVWDLKNGGYSFVFMTRTVMAIDMKELGLLNHVIASAVTCLIFLYFCSLGEEKHAVLNCHL